MTVALVVLGVFAAITALTAPAGPLSGPAFRERHERQRRSRAMPRARVTYLPDSRCRGLPDFVIVVAPHDDAP